MYELEETTEKMKDSKTIVKEPGSMTIASFDFASMGRVTQLIYITIVAAILGGIIGVLYKAV